VHFAAFKNHIGFYPIPSGIEAFKKELSLYKQGKGSVPFPLDKPVPYDLVKKIIEFRVAENMKESKVGAEKVLLKKISIKRTSSSYRQLNRSNPSPSSTPPNPT
jgi:hypothetical protein